MGIMHPRESAYVKEMAKWEMRDVMVGDTFIQAVPREQGGRKDDGIHREYPKGLYKASRPNDTNIEVTDYLTVADESEERLQKGQGWRPTHQEAIALVMARDQEMAVIAANRNFNDRGMSQNALAESRAVESQSSEHLGEIPRKAIKRGRPKKAAAAVEG